MEFKPERLQLRSTNKMMTMLCSGSFHDSNSLWPFIVTDEQRELMCLTPVLKLRFSGFKVDQQVYLFTFPSCAQKHWQPPLGDDLDASATLRSNCSALAKLSAVYFWINFTKPKLGFSSISERICVSCVRFVVCNFQHRPRAEKKKRGPQQSSSSTPPSPSPPAKPHRAEPRSHHTHHTPSSR